MRRLPFRAYAAKLAGVNPCRALPVIAALSSLAAVAAAALPSITAGDALRHLKTDVDTANASPIIWNGVPGIMVDRLSGPDGAVQRLVELVHRTSDGTLRSIRVTMAEPEGGDAEVEAWGLANADADPALELALILRWPVVHQDVSGTLYEVRLFDDVKAGEAALRPLTRLSAHFGSGCACQERDGRRRSFRYASMTAVRRELARLGY